MVSTSAHPPIRPPSLNEATKRSTSAWQDDFQALYHHAKDRFPDVVWELCDEDSIDAAVEEVWGHKAVIYARAPPTFQARYFSFRPPPISSPGPYSTSPTPSLPMPVASALSLSLGPDYPYPASLRSASPSQFRANSPAPSSTIGIITRISLNQNPVLFANELEYLYTGKGLGQAFEFLFDANEKGPEGDQDAEEARIDKLRRDLVYMWRSRLYSDVRIELTGVVSPTSVSEEETTAVFSSHRFVLISRSPYFFDQFVTYGAKGQIGESATLRLPSPPFTPPALHFTLGFLYTGTLNFSNRTYDLDTAFAILCSSNYLQLQSLHDEIQARIVVEMLHGLFHAFLEFSEYERITGGKWGTGGCRCRQCARRAPRTLEFAMRPDVKNVYLDRGARRALVGLFGEGWCTSEFANLPQKTKDGLMKGLAKRTTPQNVFPLLFASHAAMSKLNNVMDAWADGVREMVLAARKVIDDVLCNEAEKCFQEREWVDIMENDGMGRFEDGERVEWTMEALRRGINEINAGMLYQTLVSTILLRPHPTEPNETLLSSTSQIRVQVDQARVDVLKYLRRRWINVRQESGFDQLEGWALKEISHELDVPEEDLLNTPPNAVMRGQPTRTGLRPSLSRVEDVSERDSMSIHSLRTSVLNKNMAKHNAQPATSSAASVRSVARSVASTASRTSAAPSFRSRVTTSSVMTDRERKVSRPDSKLAPGINRSVSGASSSASSMMDVDTDGTESLAESVMNNNSSTALTAQAGASASSRRPGVGTRAPVVVTSVQRPKSSTASVTSVRSHASTIRRNAAGNAEKSSLRPPPSPAPRPSSTLSMSSKSETSTASSAFKTARESVAGRDSVGRSRRMSTASIASTSARSTTSRSPRVPAPALTSGSSARGRRPSDASITSVATSRARKASTQTTKGVTRPAARTTPEKTSTLKKTPSSTSIRSTASTAASKRVAKTSLEKGKEPAKPTKPLPPSPPSKENIKPESTNSTITVKGKVRTDPIAADNRSVGSESVSKSDTTGSTTTRGTLKRKESNDTITFTTPPTADSKLEHTITVTPKGATLEMGIPCIVSSKRKRFRAFARYIGEVEGELGPWVGVEVPVGEEWADEQLEGRQWNDGTWGGVRYFDVGTSTSEWGDDDLTTHSRRRRTDWVNGLKGSKREGDTLTFDRKKRFRPASPSVSDVSSSEYRGLFVRPQQVLYVVDAGL